MQPYVIDVCLSYYSSYIKSINVVLYFQRIVQSMFACSYKCQVVHVRVSTGLV